MSKLITTHHNVNVLYANDIAKTRQFFEGVLGFEVSQEHPSSIQEQSNSVVQYASAGGAEVALMPAREPFRAAGAEYWFTVPHLHAYNLQLNAPHTTPSREVIETFTPDGHKLVCHEGEQQ